MTYLVTGGAGFIGSNIVKRLIDLGKKVRVIDNFSSGGRANIEPHLDELELIEGDIRDFWTVAKAVEGVDYIFHQAALPSVPRSIDNPLTSNEVNINGTLNVLEAARFFGIKRLIYASSSSIYGDTEVMPKRENMAPSPLSPYAITKLAGERYCQIFYRLYGLETVALRYFNVFGPHQNPYSQYSAVIPKFITKLLAGKKPLIYGDGSQSRDFTFIENVVGANLLACETDECLGRVINIACGKEFTLNMLVRKLQEIIGSDIEIEYADSQPGDVQRSIADITDAEKYLGYKVQVGFEEGLKRTVDYFRDKMSTGNG
ncbi:MAG: NAD-dependent epimerase/dehydratase family protein [candidate division Zixibacteria bacterium]|nr:NAD-dependent epimerase/dehydratase family protein [candidate division Zixibacteria bacterium]